jgi:hypothetical protein
MIGDENVKCFDREGDEAHDGMYLDGSQRNVRANMLSM